MPCAFGLLQRGAGSLKILGMHVDQHDFGDAQPPATGFLERCSLDSTRHFLATLDSGLQGDCALARVDSCATENEKTSSAACGVGVTSMVPVDWSPFVW